MATSTPEVALAGAGGDAVAAAAPGQTLPMRHRLLVAVLAIAFAVGVFVTYTPGLNAAIAAFAAAVLVVLAATDLERRIIPNRIVLPAALLVLLARVAAEPGRSPKYILAAAGVGVAFLIPNLINRSSIGMGDVKFLFLLGAALGPRVIAAIAIASFSIFPFAVGALIRGGLPARKTTLPFGPFLAVGGLVVLLIPSILGHGLN
jgi:prepilin signal peptidase PulO-like enzyme (type II secretory pathway)